jgi:hypothetical protein
MLDLNKITDVKNNSGDTDGALTAIEESVSRPCQGQRQYLDPPRRLDRAREARQRQAQRGRQAGGARGL